MTQLEKVKSEYDQSYNSIGEIVFDIDGWADAKKYKPVTFTLVLLKTAKTSAIGWWVGNEWYSRKLKKDEEVLFWKKKTPRDFTV